MAVRLTLQEAYLVPKQTREFKGIIVDSMSSYRQEFSRLITQT